MVLNGHFRQKIAQIEYWRSAARIVQAVPTYELYGEEISERPDFWLHCETIPSRSSLHHWEIGLHRHRNFFQILYIAEGMGDAVFGDVTHTIPAPAVVTVPPGVSHGFRFSRDVDGFVFTVLASQLPVPLDAGKGLGAWFATPRLTPVRDGEDDLYLSTTLRRLAMEWAGRGSQRTVLLDGYLATALALTARLADAPDDGDQAGKSENERRVERFEALLREHYLTHQPAAFYARELGLTPTHLNRIMQAMTGKSVRDTIADRLLDAAQRDLVFTRASAQEISFRLGFSDPTYFSRFFVRHTGKTPRAWRMAEREKLGS